MGRDLAGGEAKARAGGAQKAARTAPRRGQRGAVPAGALLHSSSTAVGAATGGGNRRKRSGPLTRRSPAEVIPLRGGGWRDEASPQSTDERVGWLVLIEPPRSPEEGQSSPRSPSTYPRALGLTPERPRGYKPLRFTTKPVHRAATVTPFAPLGLAGRHQAARHPGSDGPQPALRVGQTPHRLGDLR